MFKSAPRVAYLIILQIFLTIISSQSFAESLENSKKEVGTELESNTKEVMHHSDSDEKRLLKRLANIKTVSSVFIQKLYTSDSNEPQITEGKLIVAGGDKFRLEYTKPYEQLYVANGKEFLFYDVDLEQITIKPQPAELANTPAMILSNPIIFVKKYYVKSITDSTSEEYILNARIETSAYNKVLLTFKGSRLTTMLIEDSFGQETELNFKSIVYNKKIPDETFNFKLPEGVDVIRSTQQTNKNLKIK